MKSRLFVLSALFLSLLACEKGDTNEISQEEFSGEFQTLDSANVSSLVMYTKNGETSDEQLIIKYLGNHFSGSFQNFFFFNNNKIPAPLNVNLKIINSTEGSIKIADNINPQPVYTRPVEFTNSTPQLIIKDKDSSTIINDPVIKEHCISLQDSLFAVIPEKNCTLNSNGIDQNCGFCKTYPINIKNDQLTVPVLNYTFTNGPGSGCALEGWNKINNVNPNITSLLESTDTLVVLSLEIPMIKK